ncbi:MAG TPA: hypothetical protein ENJ28_05040 [Gammaproteobacteria bacterium]|nr:hypothetical protein [Gammaproteobacteria bacterium]
MSIQNLINKSKSKGLPNEITNKKPSIFANKTNTPNTAAQTKTGINKPVVSTKPKPFKLGIGVAKTKPVSTDEKLPDTIHNEVSSDSPLKELSSVLQNNPVLSDNSISSILGDMSDAITEDAQNANAAKTNTQNSLQQNIAKPPTLDDLSKFVFEEQPDESTEEIAAKFSSMLDGLLEAVGSDIPTVLSDTLKFMKEHAFLAEILKPEEIGKLVKVMGKSYGYVVNNQVQKGTKKKAKVKEQNDILNSLDNLSF